MKSRLIEADIEQNKEIMELKIDMAKIQTDLNYTKDKVDKIDSKIDKFITCADSKYATKEIELKVKEHSEKINKLDLKVVRYISYASGVVAVIVFLINKFL